MAIMIDLIVIAILLLSIFLGYKKGLIGVTFKILSFLIAIIITLILYRPISNYILNNTKFATNIENTISEKLSTTKIEEGQIEQTSTDLPNVVVNYINTEIINTVNQTGDALIQAISKELARTIINIIVVIAIFVITRLLLLFAKAILSAVAELPIIKQFNEVGGIIYGILRGIILIYILLAILSLILPMLDKTAILSIINQSIITKMLYNNNLILMLFLK